ncbi:hypothetical protein C8A05DRAFT_44914 [Staphylotrichum tortipilum]|uniref:Azaphilone pigments biosynthesis cluster protein L N-terminal domain-containing protein n=1 Tax=Staphylotrichum tortipilum TaxID=2831512 RepID=A0AAN6MID5_9PEZI|nr:hypothetical protein C8A05DRAFT_44914 [Staphylotrichum longicolle]
MAEGIGLASGLLTLADFTFKSSVALYQTVQSIRHHPDTVQDLQQELAALQGALRSLTETVGTTGEADFSALNLPLKRCGTACHEFEQKLLSCVSRSGSVLQNFRGWARLRYLGDDVDSFRRTLAGYKSIILIAITDVTLRKSSITSHKLEEHRVMIETATANLEDRLQVIDDKLESIFQHTVSASDTDAAELLQIKEDRLSTQRCLQICNQLSDHIDQIQIPPMRRNPSSPGLIDPGRVTSEGIKECKERLAVTAATLDKNMQELMERLVKKSKAVMSNEEEAEELAKLQADWESARECIGICSKADTNLNENISVIDNFATGDDAVQFLVSTDGKTIHAKNRGYGMRPRQLGGHLSDESLQQVSRDMSLVAFHNAVDGRPSMRDNSRQVSDDVVDRSSVGFQERHGRGFKLESTVMASKEPTGGEGK